MRKLRLDLDALQVESFLVTAAAEADGTVEGRNYQYTEPTAVTCDDCGGGVNSVGTCVGPTFCCPATWRPSCAATCIYTDCGNSCYTWWCPSCFGASCPGTCDAADTCAQVMTCASA